MTSKYPLATVVSRALRRDAGIRTTPLGQRGFHVSGKGDYPCLIDVDLSGARESAAAATDLHAHLVALGWGVRPVNPKSPTFVYVTRVPTLAQRRANPHVPAGHRKTMEKEAARC